MYLVLMEIGVGAVNTFSIIIIMVIGRYVITGGGYDGSFSPIPHDQPEELLEPPPFNSIFDTGAVCRSPTFGNSGFNGMGVARYVHPVSGFINFITSY